MGFRPNRPIDHNTARRPAIPAWGSPFSLTETPAMEARAHIPEKWVPVFRKGYALMRESRAQPDSFQSGCALVLARAEVAEKQHVIWRSHARRRRALPRFVAAELRRRDLPFRGAAVR